jgi:hypothetical protein
MQEQQLKTTRPIRWHEICRAALIIGLIDDYSKGPVREKIACRFRCRIVRPIIRRLFEDEDFSVTRVGDGRQFPTRLAKII